MMDSSQFDEDERHNDNGIKLKSKPEKDVIETTIIFNRNITDPSTSNNAKEISTHSAKKDYHMCEDRIRQYFDKWTKFKAESIPPTASKGYKENNGQEILNEYEEVNEYEEISDDENMDLTLINKSKSGINSNEDNPYEPITWFDNEKNSNPEKVSRTNDESFKYDECSLDDMLNANKKKGNKPASCTTVAIPAVFVELWEGKDKDDIRKSATESTEKEFNRTEREPTPFFLDPEQKGKAVNIPAGRNLLNTNPANESNRNVRESTPFFKDNTNTGSGTECEKVSFKHRYIFPPCYDKSIVSNANTDSQTLQLPGHSQNLVRGPRESTPFCTREDKENQNFVKSCQSKRLPHLSLSLSLPSSPDSSCPSSPQTPSSPPTLSVPSPPPSLSIPPSPPSLSLPSSPPLLSIPCSQELRPREQMSPEPGQSDKYSKGKDDQHSAEVNASERRSRSMTRRSGTSMPPRRKVMPVPRGESPHHPHYYNHQTPRSASLSPERLAQRTQTRLLKTGPNLSGAPRSLSQTSARLPRMNFTQKVTPAPELTMEVPRGKTILYRSSSLDKNGCASAESKMNNNIGDSANLSIKKSISLTSFANTIQPDLGTAVHKEDLSEKSSKASDVSVKSAKPPVSNKHKKALIDMGNKVKRAALTAYQVASAVTHQSRSKNQNAKDENAAKQIDLVKSDVKSPESKRQKLEKQRSLDKFESKPIATKVDQKGMIKSFSFPTTALAKTAQSIKNSAQSLNAITNKKQNESSDKEKKNKNTSKQRNKQNYDVLITPYDEDFEMKLDDSEKVSNDKYLDKDEEFTTAKNVIDIGKTKHIPAQNDLKTTISTQNQNIKSLKSEEIYSSKNIPEQSGKRHTPVSSNMDDTTASIASKEYSNVHDANLSSTTVVSSQPPLSTSLNLGTASSDINSTSDTLLTPRENSHQHKSIVNKEKHSCSSQGSSLTRKLSDKLSKYRKHIFSESKDKESTEIKRPTDSEEPNENVRNNQSTLNWEKYSPFGPYSVEGFLCVLLATIFCLYLQMPGEVFVCYIMACYFIFCIFRIARLIR